LGKDRVGEKAAMKICAVIPALNEAVYISDIIKDIKAIGIDAVVIDDGSKDATSSIAGKAGAYLIRHPVRLGKGASIKDGLNYAIIKGYDIVITMDADGQHQASDIPRFLDMAKSNSVHAIVGNRMSNPKNMPPIRILTNRLMSFIISAICRQNIPDTQCGFRLFKREAIVGLDINSRKFEIESELLIKLSRRGCRIRSLPIMSIYGDETSQIRPFRDTMRFIRFLIRILLNRT
jgi:glycosyltransferase involved in cell wall biosynthesis